MRRFFVPACLERRKGGGKSIPRSVKLIVSHILTYRNNKLAVSLLQKINISCKLISKHDNGTVRDGQSGDRHAHPACTPGRGAHAGKAGGEDRCIHGVCKPIGIRQPRARAGDAGKALADAARKPGPAGVGRRARRRRGSVSCCVGAGALAPPAYAGGQPGAKPVCRDGPFGCRAAGMLTHAFFEKGGRARPGERVKRCVERISGRKTALCAARRTYEKTARGTKCCSAGLFSLYNIIFEESGRRFVTAFAGPSAPAGAQHPSARARWPRPAAPFRVWAGPCPAPSQ